MNKLDNEQPTCPMSLRKIIYPLLRGLKYCLAMAFLCVFGMLLIDFTTSYLVRDRVYTDIEALPTREYALVLGTAKYYPSGKPNLYYKYRLETTKQLYLANKSHFFLMSGDNQTPYYNEPKMMTQDLIQMGIASSRIKQDYAGYNTLDSILRADKVFKLSPFIIVSQRFHCERALLIAQFHDIDAICFAAKYPEKHYKVRIREMIARTGMLVHLLAGTQPTTLLEAQIIESNKQN